MNQIEYRMDKLLSGVIMARIFNGKKVEGILKHRSKYKGSHVSFLNNISNEILKYLFPISVG